MKGIDKQLREGDEQMMTVSPNGQFIAHMTVEVHFRCMGHQTAGIFESHACQSVAAYDVIGTDSLTALDKRSGKQYAHHIVEGVSLHIHSLGNLAFLVVIQRLAAFAQHL